MSHNEGLYPVIPKYISPFLIRRQLATLAAALAAAHYSLRIPLDHAIHIDMIHDTIYCKDVLQTKYIQNEAALHRSYVLSTAIYHNRLVYVVLH